MSETMDAAAVTGALTRPVSSVRGAAVGIGLAVVTNVAVYLAGDAGAPIRVVTGWEPDGAHMGVGDVIAATVVWVAIGAVALWAFERFRPDGFREWAAAAALVAVASIVPLLRLDIDTGSKVALSTMHLVVGAATIVGQLAVRRPAAPTSAQATP
jgi:hypothetical protein